MEKEDIISVQWAQEDVETSYSLLNNSNNNNNKTLHVSDSSSVQHQGFFTVHTAMVYVIRVC